MNGHSEVYEQKPERTQSYVTDQISRVVCVQPYQTTLPKKWKRGLMDCFNDGLSQRCCKTFLCPCVVFGELAEKTEYGNCCLCGNIYSLLCAPIWVIPFIGTLGNCACLVHIGLRKRIREQNGLPSDPCNDFLASWLCGCCALYQEAIEIDLA